MKTLKNIFLIAILAAFMFSCSQSRHEKSLSKETAMADSIATSNSLSYSSPPKDENSESDGKKISTSVTGTGYVGSSAAVENKKDTLHKFIRTAEMKFRVKNVAKATYAIEEITSRFDGFVTFTDLSSNIDNITTTAISSDSSLETMHFTVANLMTLRVPNIKLDTTLKTIATLIDYLDYRRIKADDVRLQYLANKITQQRVATHEERVKKAIDTKGKKLNETTRAEESLINKQEQADNAKLSNLSLQDQINYSTITLNIYQRQEIRRWVLPNEKNIDAFEPGFGNQLLDALKFGWKILDVVIVFLARLWGLFLFALIIYILYRKFGHKLRIKR
ncbi:MAG: DUF4349 domain-containing protein [Bacteroidota bacterium]